MRLHRAQDQLGEVVDDDVGAVLAERRGVVRRGRRRRRGRTCRRARLDPGERVLEDTACGGLDAERLGAGQVGVRRGLAVQVRVRRRRCRRSRASKRSAIPAASSTSWQLALEETTARAQPGRARRFDEADRALVGLHPVARRSASRTSSFLRLPSPWTVSASGGSSGSPSGSSIPRDCEEDADAVIARLAVDVFVVVASRVERHELFALRLGPLLQELVEGLLPRACVDVGGLRQHPVEVEEERGDRAGQCEFGDVGHRH